MKTKRQKPEFPMEITRGDVTVKIYRNPNKTTGYVSYQVPDRSSGKRKFRTFSDLDEAKREAAAIAKRKSSSLDVDVLTLRSSDRASYLLAVDHVAPTGAKLETAAFIYAEAFRILGGDRILEAARYLAKKQPGALPKRTVREVLDELLESKKSKGVGERYLADLEYRLGAFAESFTGLISNITGNEIQQFLDGLELSTQSQVNYARVIGTLYRFAIRRGYLSKDFDELDRLEKVRVRNLESIEIYTPAEMARLLNAASHDFVPCIAVAGFAGIRSAEIERLEWSDIDLAGGHITIGAKRSKTASRRVVPISANLAEWLAPYSKERGAVWKGTQHVFYKEQERTAKATAHGDEPALKWKQNALRHSFISYRLAETQNVNQVALEAGNSPTMIFKHYRELVKETDADAWFSLRPKNSAGH